MKRLRTYAVFAVGSVILIGAFQLLRPSVAEAPPSTSVVVVNTSNQPVPVRDVDNPATEPFQETLESSCTNTSACNVQLTDPPAGKRLVVETVSAQVIVPTGAATLLGFHFNNPGANLYLAPVKTGSSLAVGSGIDIYHVTQQVRAYHQGSGSGCGVSTINASVNIQIICTVTGYFVNAS